MDWITDEFATADLGDARLTKRLCCIGQRLWTQVQATIPAACRGWAEVIGAYRFWAHPRVTLAALFTPHQDATVRRVQACPQVYVIQDTTECEYTGKRIAGLGPLNYAHRTGLLLHVSLVITPERVPLGVWRAAPWVRTALDRKKTAARKQEALVDKESGRWLIGYQAACALRAAAPTTEVISLADREGDLYEIFAEATTAHTEASLAAGWVIRARHDRTVVTGAGRRTLPLSGVLALTPPVGTGTLAVPAAPGQPARQATVVLKTVTVTLRPPYRPERVLPPVTVTVVLVQERTPPPGSPPIRWVLLTSLPVIGPADAARLAALYAARWEIEVFFRTWKTGCRIEQLALSTRDRLEPCLGLYLILAWRLCYLVRLGATAPDLPWTVAFSPREWEAIRALHPPTARRQPPALRTVGEMLRALARLGGYLDRAGDGPPGVEVLWRGLQHLYTAVQVLENLRAREEERCV